MAKNTDTDRLNWLIEQLLTRTAVRGLPALFLGTGIEVDELTCEGDVSLGERMRTIIDERIESTAK
jgi:hypothetical protein